MRVMPGAIPTAIVLSATTLFVFRSAQSLGPESAVRRFVTSVKYGDVVGARQYVVQGLDSPAGSYLLAQARASATGGEMTITERRRQGSIVVVVTSNTSRSRFDVWVVSRVPQGWAVNAELTASLLQRLQGT